MKYTYITEDNLENRQKYTYSAFGGKEFLNVYFDSRKHVLREMSLPMLEQEAAYKYVLKNITGFPMQPEGAGIDMRYLLAEELKRPQTVTDNVNRSLLDSALKTFEVRKRLYHFYSEKFKPQDEEDYRDTSLYILFAMSMNKAYEETKSLKYLNALLKCNDILISLYNEANKSLLDIESLSFVLYKELGYIQALCKDKNIEV